MKKSADKNRSFFETLFIPDYDELTLYSMSYTCMLLFLVNNPPHNWDFSNMSIQSENFLLVLLFLLFMAGMFLSFYHAFTNRKKTLIEKKLMVLFAALLCGFSGIWGGTYMLVHSPDWITVFPLWNIISGWILLGALRGGGLSEENISDKNVQILQVVSSTVIVSFVFFSCYLGFKLNWATTFSICIAWVTTFNSSVNNLITRERIKLTQV